MNKINKEQVTGLIRHILTFASVFLIAKGIIPQTLANEIITGLVVLIMIIWSWVDKSERNLSVWLIFVRKFLTIAGAFIMGYGVLNNEVWNEVISIVMTFTSIILSYIGNEPIIEQPIIKEPIIEEQK